MRTVLVYVDPADIFRIYVAGNLVTSVNDQALITAVCRKARKSSAVKACADDEKVILAHQKRSFREFCNNIIYTTWRIFALLYI